MTIALELIDLDFVDIIERKRRNRFMDDFATYGHGKTYFITYNDWTTIYGFKNVLNGPKQVLSARHKLELADVVAVNFRGVDGWTIKRK